MPQKSEMTEHNGSALSLRYFAFPPNIGASEAENKYCDRLCEDNEAAQCVVLK